MIITDFNVGGPYLIVFQKEGQTRKFTDALFTARTSLDFTKKCECLKQYKVGFISLQKQEFTSHSSSDKANYIRQHIAMFQVYIFCISSPGSSAYYSKSGMVLITLTIVYKNQHTFSNIKKTLFFKMGTNYFAIPEKNSLFKIIIKPNVFNIRKIRQNQSIMSPNKSMLSSQVGREFFTQMSVSLLALIPRGVPSGTGYLLKDKTHSICYKVFS